ncbi:type III secretion system stator protein SctL [Erwinia sp. CGal63]|uniref:type III secretion system stator protein SctL n=1 Tax=Erwinia sp. CGal63 TaxID=2919889 RepID=UPI00300B54F2
MWATKKLSVLVDSQQTIGPLLTREALADHQQALSLLQTAEQQAQARLLQAEEAAQQLLADARESAAAAVAEAQQAFIANAEAFFADWQQERQRWHEALIPRAEALLKQAMGQLLAELPAEARLTAMLHQLQQAQGRQAAATLNCAPAVLEEVACWLRQHPLDWQLVGDSSLDNDTLRLTTENGELSLNWPQLCAALLPA